MDLLSFKCIDGRLQELRLEKSSMFVMFSLGSTSNYALPVSLLDLLDPSLTKIFEFILENIQGVSKSVGGSLFLCKHDLSFLTSKYMAQSGVVKVSEIVCEKH